MILKSTYHSFGATVVEQVSARFDASKEKISLEHVSINSQPFVEKLICKKVHLWNSPFVKKSIVDEILYPRTICLAPF